MQLSEPLAADIRAETLLARLKVLKERLRLLAPIFGCTFDDLRQRCQAQGRRRLIAVAGVLAVAALAFAGLSGLAAQMYLDAEFQRQEASSQRDRALSTQSLFLADLARQHSAKSNFTLGMLLAIEALPDKSVLPVRPYVPEAEFQLDSANNQIHERTIFAGHDRVSASKFSPDGTRVASGFDDGTVRIWDAATGLQVGPSLAGHSKSVNDLAFSPDGTRLVTVSDDNTARLWDIRTGSQIGPTFAGHTRPVIKAAFSPDGRRIVTASYDRTARVWGVETGKQEGPAITGFVSVLNDRDSPISVAFNTDGKRLIVADKDAARVLDAVTHRPIGAKLVLSKVGEIETIAISGNGKRIATNTSWGMPEIWDLQLGRKLDTSIQTDTRLESVSLNENGTRLVTIDYDRRLFVWDMATGEQIGTPLIGHDDFVDSAAFSPDGARVVSWSNDTTARIWEVQPRESRATALKGHTGVVSQATFSPDGGRVATLSHIDGTVRLWNTATGKPLDPRMEGNRTVSFSADGQKILTTSTYRTSIGQQWDAATGSPAGESIRDVLPTRYSYENGRIVTSSSDGTTRLVNPVGGGSIGSAIPISGISAFSADGKRVVSAIDGFKAQAWDFATQLPLGSELEGHTDEINDVGFDTTGTRVVTASLDTTIRMWDVATGNQIGAPFTGHQKSVTSAVFRPDGKRILSASWDGTARIWDVATGKAVASFTAHKDRVTSAAYSPDGRRVVTSSWDKTARIWDTFWDTDELMANAKKAAPRCLTTKERSEAFLGPEPPAWCIEMGKWPYSSAGWKDWLAKRRAGIKSEMPSAP